MRKYAYYLRKPRSAITKDILRLLVLGGMLVMASSSPYPAMALWRRISREKTYSEKKFSDTFSRLRKSGLLETRREGHDLKILLTEKGKAAAGYLQIDALQIPKPKRWDGKWRIVLFDIANLKTLQRNALRGKLRDLGFIPFQKSAWIHPFPCEAEIDILKEFFGFSDKEIVVVIASHITNQNRLRQLFGL